MEYTAGTGLLGTRLQISRENKNRTSILINLAEEIYTIIRDLPAVFTGGIALAYLEYIKGREVKRPPEDIDIAILKGYLPRVRKRIIQNYQEMGCLIIGGERRDDESIIEILLWAPYNVYVHLFTTQHLKSREVGKIRVIDFNEILKHKLHGYLRGRREKDLIDIYRLILLDAVDAKDLALMIKDMIKNPILREELQVDLPVNENIIEKLIEKLYEKIDAFPQFDNSEKEKIKGTFDIVRAELKRG